jgi:hypothetical protein
MLDQISVGIKAWQRKHALLSGPKILSVVSIEVYPVRYVNPTDLPYVEM